MSAPASPIGGSHLEQANDAREPTTLAQIEALLEKAADYLNPILVKEARQAMKSMQFVLTFGMVMLLGWLWTFLIMAFHYSVHQQSLPYVATGQVVLGGYLTILLIPMMVVVPFMAFHSLASERHDGTFELLSITSLNSRQIITGKLGSAVLQMIIYYSALAPSVAFTYMLRGIDLFTIGLALGWVFLISLVLTTLALLLAAFSRTNIMQILLSMVLLVALLATLIAAVSLAWWWVYLGPQAPYQMAELWFGNLCVASFVASFCVMFVVAAAASLSFESDNRSTALRYVMIGQHILIVGWSVYYWLVIGSLQVDEAGWILVTGVCVNAGYWWFMGALLTGETGELSPRVRRDLPSSLLGRITLTWFNPGSGTGYVFVLANLGTFAALAIFFMWTETLSRYLPFPKVMVNRFNGAFTGGTNEPEMSLMIVACLMYVAIYLGLGRLIAVFFRRHTFVPLPMVFVIQFVLLNAGWALPYVYALSTIQFFGGDYGIVQTPNWAWTLYMIVDSRNVSTLWNLYPANWMLLFGGAILMFFLNLAVAHREIEQTREETPDRVQEDDAELNPEPEPGPSSPWDHDE